MANQRKKLRKTAQKGRKAAAQSTKADRSQPALLQKVHESKGGCGSSTPNPSCQLEAQHSENIPSSSIDDDDSGTAIRSSITPPPPLEEAEIELQEGGGQLSETGFWRLCKSARNLSRAP